MAAMKDLMQTLTDRLNAEVKPCEYTEAHEAHMELNGECPWCGMIDPMQADFGSIDDDGTVRDRYGNVIEHH